LSPSDERALKPGDEFQECDDCPMMVVVPGGSFTMGSPESEEGRRNDEGPQHTVTIGRPFAVGKFHVTVDQFAAFVAATGYADPEAKCWGWKGRSYGLRSDRSWRDPGFPQSGYHPAVCLAWTDAKAVNWVARKTGKAYRLLSEAEWEYAARGRTQPGSYPRYFFGDDEKDLCRYANVRDQATGSGMPAATPAWRVEPCNDGYVYTSPVGSFAANDFGLHDMHGNAWQWTEDCVRGDINNYINNNTYIEAPSYGSAWTAENCGRRFLRGGSWGPYGGVRAARRGSQTTNFRRDDTGLRLGRTLTP
jgi:formylglycine-generating enzyme required for sulfatase activity